ncbi:ammonium transporter [Nadsonia fulvescens var. elongata DSM 6958]|uniref:Ammonium transporter n=1 Tax=Nadsonia fulvescens var. elongata DSM 6958 TaxID=857566 RepID=A0A1E3PQH0_9ASCO|nr:ammonium transporter [Nadsonia fulvescens var. elongata DSM 6958]
MATLDLISRALTLAVTAVENDSDSDYDTTSIGFMLLCSSLIMLMSPGIGLFYAGFTRRKNALNLIGITLMAGAVVFLEWFFWGYSLAFSSTSSSHYMGDFHNAGLRHLVSASTWANVDTTNSVHIPELVNFVFQGTFAVITATIFVGSIAERGRPLPALVFTFVWTTVVYNAIVYWSWNPNGWISRLGTLDFAGGTAVHVSSGFAALAYSWFLGKREGFGTLSLNPIPHNIVLVVLGTVILSIGWLGFNMGASYQPTLRAVYVAVNTLLAGSIGGITWCILDYRLEYKWSIIGFCSGIICGLVAITPGSGFVPAWAALIISVLTTLCCNFATKLKYYVGIDDCLDIFAVHGVGGIIGMFLTGIFASAKIAALDGHTVIKGGWVNQNYIQLGYQLAECITGAAFSFTLSCAILVIMNWIPGLQLRVSKKDEEDGLDISQHGDYAYDYVEDEPEFVPRVQSTAIATAAAMVMASPSFNTHSFAPDSNSNLFNSHHPTPPAPLSPPVNAISKPGLIPFNFHANPDYTVDATSGSIPTTKDIDDGSLSYLDHAMNISHSDNTSRTSEVILGQMADTYEMQDLDRSRCNEDKNRPQLNPLSTEISMTPMFMLNESKEYVMKSMGYNMESMGYVEEFESMGFGDDNSAVDPIEPDNVKNDNQVTSDTASRLSHEGGLLSREN